MKKLVFLFLLIAASANGQLFDIKRLASGGAVTDNTIARFDGTSGQLIQDSGIAIDDSDNITGVATLTVTTLTPTNLEFEGSTVDAFETTLTAVDPTADNTATIPDGTGTLAFIDTFIESLAAEHTLSIDAATGEGYGSIHYVTGTGDINLPDATDGCSFTIITDGTNSFSIAPDQAATTDTLRVDAVDQTAGHELDNNGAAATMATVIYHSANKWMVITDGNWTAGGAND